MTPDKALHCDCGHQVSGEDEAELVERIRSHARAAHGIDFSVEDALLVVRRSRFDVSQESFTSNEGGAR